LLLQSIYHSQIASEKEYFNFNDVVREVSDKMVSRHPHVFGEDKVNKTSQQQIEDWETIKAAERKSKHQGKVLDDVAVNLPALVRAIKLQKRAARVGFDWPSYENVLDKIIEEARELTDAAADGNSAHIEEEFGDLLFTFVNLGRHLNIDAEIALKKTNNKFKKRFDFIETELEKKGEHPQDTSLNEMDVLWEKAKKILK
jgi:ATP diphosphatase